MQRSLLLAKLLKRNEYLLITSHNTTVFSEERALYSVTLHSNVQYRPDSITATSSRQVRDKLETACLEFVSRKSL
jgi:hypothetical protein